MDVVEKYQTVFVLLAILGGLALGQVSGVASLADQFILPFLTGIRR
jgi:hypothetical protein